MRAQPSGSGTREARPGPPVVTACGSVVVEPSGTAAGTSVAEKVVGRAASGLDLC